MTVPILAAAKRMCERSGWSLSNLELQKLLYIAHMFYLGTHGAPLVNGHFEAWEYGPVHPELYHHAKIFGSGAVGNVFHSVIDIGPGLEAQKIDSALELLRDARPGRLVAITHWDGGAWARHYRPGVRGIVIPNQDIEQEYRDRENGVRQRPAG